MEQSIPKQAQNLLTHHKGIFCQMNNLGFPKWTIHYNGMNLLTSLG